MSTPIPARAEPAVRMLAAYRNEIHRAYIEARRLGVLDSVVFVVDDQAESVVRVIAIRRSALGQVAPASPALISGVRGLRAGRLPVVCVDRTGRPDLLSVPTPVDHLAN